MGSNEFTRWMAFYSIQPFGVRRDNLHSAIIASTIANCHIKKRFTTSDFMIKDEVEESQTKTIKFCEGLRALASKGTP